jgi:hypothetical protein
MTTFQNKENVVKNRGQTNKIDNLNDPTVANDPRPQVEFDDLPMSGEQEERVKGGATIASPKPPEALIYDWPGEYAQRFDGIDKAS